MTVEDIIISKKHCSINGSTTQNYSKCSSILMVLGNVPQYPVYQLLEALSKVLVLCLGEACRK
jgi:hypothetical protein